jgi:hypothetical protein
VPESGLFAGIFDVCRHIAQVRQAHQLVARRFAFLRFGAACCKTEISARIGVPMIDYTMLFVSVVLFALLTFLWWDKTRILKVENDRKRLARNLSWTGKQHMPSVTGKRSLSL